MTTRGVPDLLAFEASTALAWDIGHAGYYDNPEAFAWIDGLLGR